MEIALRMAQRNQDILVADLGVKRCFGTRTPFSGKWRGYQGPIANESESASEAFGPQQSKKCSRKIPEADPANAMS
jgi:hypothetical protein